MSDVKQWTVTLPNPDGYNIEPFDLRFHKPTKIVLASDYDALRAERDALKAELDEASPMTRCECCGSSFRLHKMVIEEGDRWECYPCWEALNEKERWEKARNAFLAADSARENERE